MDMNYTHLALVIDRSGSMSGSEEDVIGGINTLLQEQKKLKDKLTVSLVQLDNEYEVNYDFEDIQKIGEFRNFKPRGGTALYDVVARLINETGTRLSNTPESLRPAKVLFVVYTDGGENASRETTKLRLDEMIKHQETKYNWDFMFMAADLSVQESVRNYGQLTNNSYSYAGPKGQTQDMYKNLSGKLANYRCPAGWRWR